MARDILDMTGLSDRKRNMLMSCYNALMNADEKEIEKAYTKHTQTDDWLEEEATPQYPVIKVVPTGIFTSLYVNDHLCDDKTLYDTL